MFAPIFPNPIIPMSMPVRSIAAVGSAVSNYERAARGLWLDGLMRRRGERGDEQARLQSPFSAPAASAA